MQRGALDASRAEARARLSARNPPAQLRL